MSKQNRISPVRTGIYGAVILALSTQTGLAQTGSPRHQGVADDGVVEITSGTEQTGRRKNSRPFGGSETITLSALYGAGITGFDGLDGGLQPESLQQMKSLKPVDGREIAEVVLGYDTRVRVNPSAYPSRAVALITFEGGRCTGWMIGPDTVATAGHCVHSGGAAGRWRERTSYRVYPGFDGDKAPFGWCTAKRLYSVIGWTRSRNERFDYGAVKLNCTVGNSVGWFGFYSTAASHNLDHTPATISGYPGDKPLEQWQSGDKIRATESRQLYYANDTAGGMSGSPIWHDRNGPYAMAIHVYGTHGSGNHSDYNHGTRIVAPVYKNLLNWKKAH